MMTAHYRLKSWILLFIFTLTVSGCVAGRGPYRRGLQAEVVHDYETAMVEYRAALDEAPDNIEYQLKFEQVRFAAAFEHFENGRRAFSAGELEAARFEFERALALDPTHALAEQELERVREILQNRAQSEPEPEVQFDQMREAARTDPSIEAQLEPAITGPIDIQMNQDSRVAFKTLAELAGLNVIFDPDFREVRVPIELKNVDFYEALDILSLQTRSFWKPVNRTTILVSPDNQTKRREHEDHILKTVYLTNSVSSTEITEAITALRTLLNMRFIAQSTTMNAIIMRDTPDRIAIAEKIVEDIDKAKPEVVVEALVLEVDRNTLRELGILPPQGTNLTFTNPETTDEENSVPLRDLEAVNTQNFSINIPATAARFLATSSQTRLLQNPRVRATDGKLAQIRIGSRVPVPSGSFQPAFVGATGTPVVQFQYVDIGVNLDITPRVLLNRDVSIAVLVQVQALAGDRDAGGVLLPVFTNRSIQHEIRLAEGETNILGGIITDTEAVSLTGIPGLKEIPVLRHLFSQERTTRDETEIIIMLTPHIVRMPAISEANLRGLNIGTEVNTRLRTAPSVPAAETPPGPAEEEGVVPAATGTANLLGVPTSPARGAEPDVRPAEATLEFSPSPVVLGIDAPTAVSLEVNGSDISGAEIELSFDPSSIMITEIREGGFLSRDGNIVAIVQGLDTDAGTVRITLDRPPGAQSLSGSGALVTLLVQRSTQAVESMLRVTGFRVY